MISRPLRVGSLAFASALSALGCAGHGAAPVGAAAVVAAASPARPPIVVRIEPTSGAIATRPAGLTALDAELRRSMAALTAKGKPPPYFAENEAYDKTEVVISASQGSLVQSSSRRSRILDTDVRVGDYALDSTHIIRSSDFDFSSVMGGHPVAAPLDDGPDGAGPLRAVAWAEIDRRYEDAAERYVKILAQRTLKVAEEDPSDDFSREKPVTYVGPRAEIAVDVPTWEARVRALSARFEGQGEILDSQVTLQVVSDTRWIVNSEGTLVQTGRNYVRVSAEADARADDGMELERVETFDAATFGALPSVDVMARAVDTMIVDLKALRRAPLADPFIGPAILEGRAAGVFFHEIFGHRVEGHRQKNDEEGQTFAKKIGQPIMPSFISVYDDPTLARIGDADLNGFYRFDDEGVPAQRATLVDGGVLKTFLLSRSPTRGFTHSNGHGRRQEGRVVVSRQGNLVVEPTVAVPVAELRRRLRAEAQRQGKPYGLLFRDISGGFTNTARGGPQAFKVLPILVYRVWVDGRPDELVRGVDLVGTPLAALSKILAASDDYQTFNGYCGAESGFVPVSATSPSLLVEQIESERRDKGSDKPPILAAPPTAPAVPTPREPQSQKVPQRER
ncbi:MAG TPA: metallopeptidase TldD-related protein [Polyangia bacterium]|nr:metallopeptidase TldD-related protein [Polyangia bacterium]